MYLPPSSTTWDDIVLALVRSDELTGNQPQAGFAQRSLRLVRAEESAAETRGHMVATGDRYSPPLLSP